ncbi:MAG TPA: hypothetical protein VLI92_04935, partial [Candidatus Saccharimonadales bacterium]|nr:hypothetical protein [Candidatus Saccharimonadales bacterium]
MPDQNYQQNHFNRLKIALESHHKKVVEDFQIRHSRTLKKAKQHGLTLASTAILAGSILSSSSGSIHQTNPHSSVQQVANLNNFIEHLNTLLKDKMNEQENNVIAQALSQKFGLDLAANLDGHHLNEIYGYIGAEQHLYRWQGDTLSLHNLQRTGIAPRQGAFGDFDNTDQEKYYVAVQLQELPDWNA